MPRVGVRILTLLSKDPGEEVKVLQGTRWTTEDALQVLTDAFPGFRERVPGKSFLDFGCGYGYQSVALALAGARRVVGVDINTEALERGRRLAADEGVDDRVTFLETIEPHLDGPFDYVVSQNSMEHFQEPIRVLLSLRDALEPQGKVLVRFTTPWLSPWGSHMQFFTPIPWVNVLFSEATVMEVRSRFRDDGAKRYEDVEFGLNKMTINRFEDLVASAGFRFDHRRYLCVKGLNILGRFPGVREFFINEVVAELAPVRSRETPDAELRIAAAR
jgi:SAM-dependent methyltransferase